MKTVLLYPLLPALLAVATVACRSTIPMQTPAERYDAQVATCVATLARDVGQPLAAAPDFATLHEATAWVAARLPSELRQRLARAGATVAASTRTASPDVFAGRKALRTALLGSTLEQLQAVPGCTFEQPDNAVAREALLDQFSIGLALQKKSLQARLHALGIGDSHHAKQAVFYGVVLDLGGIAWTEEQLAALAGHPDQE